MLVLRHKKHTKSLRPLFPRYIFARSDSGLVGANRMSGVTGYAGRSLENSIVDDIIIKAIKDRSDEHGIVSINYDEIQTGQAVTVLEGPFAGLQAIFSEPDDRKRSYILLDLMGKSHRIRVPNSSIQVAA
jgi:transcriptional antiterminator RfaH